MPAPESFVGRMLKQLELRPRLRRTLIAAKRRSGESGAVVTNVAPAADEAIQGGTSSLVLLGSNTRVNELDQLLAR